MLVFLSYRRRDTAFAAHAVRYALRLAGHEVFLDTGTVAAGEAFHEVVREWMERCELVLALVGPQFDVARLAEPSDAVAFEWRYARFLGRPVHAVLVDGAGMPRAQALPPDLRWFGTRTASALSGPAHGEQIDALVGRVPHLAVRPRPVRRVLWVDDEPANNERERALLRPDGIVFDNVVSSAEAVAQLELGSYDLVITDLGRRGSSDRSRVAGRALLASPVVRDGGPPVVVYAGRSAVAQQAELLALGAFGVAPDREHLLALVRQALGRAGGPPTQ